MTPQQFEAWLTTPNAERTLLIELQHAAGTEYVSNRGYLGEPVARDNQHRQYEPVLAEAVEISDRLDGQLTIGDIVLVNDGLLDGWRGYQWRGYTVTGWLGAPDWPRGDFQQVLLAVNAGLQSAEAGELVIGIQDARAQFDKPLTDELIDGTGAPVVFGQVFNASPLVIDATARRYKASALPLTALDASDRGNAGFTESVDLAAGEFTADATAQGTLTFNATGTATTAADIARQVAALYGVAVDDAALDALPIWPPGLFYVDGTSTTGSQVLDDICASLGGYWRVDELNRLQLFVQTEPQPGTVALTADDIERDGVRLVRIEEPLSQISVRYGRNYTPLQADALASPTVIGDDLHARLQQEWQTVSRTPALSGYPLAAPREFETALVDVVDADRRATAIETIRSDRRQVWEVAAFIPAIQLRAGDNVFIQHDGWPEFAAGRWVTVLANHRDLTGEQFDLEVWF